MDGEESIATLETIKRLLVRNRPQVGRATQELNMLIRRVKEQNSGGS